MARNCPLKQLAGTLLSTGRRVRLRLRQGRIESVVDLGLGSADGPWLAPGLVDLQVNGLATHDLNDRRLDAATVVQVAEALGRRGITSFLPTLITGPSSRLLRSLRTIADAPAGSGATIAGIHLEGPFISAEAGARGAHPRRHVKKPDWDLLSRFQDAARGKIRMLTLAPELDGAGPLIERCAAAGIVVAIGHSAARPQQIRAAVAAGASVSTHLGNGLQATLPRHGNLLWEQLACDRLWATLIADGSHLDNATLRVMLRSKGEQACLVSDVTAGGGRQPGHYKMAVGGRVHLGDDGRLELAGAAGLLAGSTRTLEYGVAHLVRSGLTSLPEAWAMASSRPAQLLGISATLAEGDPADIVLFGWDGAEIRLKQVLRSGELIT